MWRIRDIHIHVEKPASRVNSFFFFDSNHKIRGSVHSHTTYLLVGSSLFFPSSSSAQLLPLFRWKGGAGPVLLHCDIIPWFWNTEQRWKSSLEELAKPHHTATERLYTCAFQMSWSPTLSHICAEKAGERSLQQSHEVRKLFHKHTFVPPWSILLLKPPEVGYVILTQRLQNVWTHLLLSWGNNVFCYSCYSYYQWQRSVLFNIFHFHAGL